MVDMASDILFIPTLHAISQTEELHLPANECLPFWTHIHFANGGTNNTRAVPKGKVLYDGHGVLRNIQSNYYKNQLYWECEFMSVKMNMVARFGIQLKVGKSL